MCLERASGAHSNDERQHAHRYDRADDYEAHEAVFGFHGTEHDASGRAVSYQQTTETKEGPAAHPTVDASDTLNWSGGTYNNFGQLVAYREQDSKNGAVTLIQHSGILYNAQNQRSAETQTMTESDKPNLTMTNTYTGETYNQGGYLDAYPVAEARLYEKELYTFLETRHPELLRGIAEKKDIKGELTDALKKALAEFADTFQVQGQA